MSNYRWIPKVNLWAQRGKNFLVHDEENFCRSGDKVVIRRCRKLTDRKHYYVRNIVRHVGRQNVTGIPQTQYEQDALDYNEKLRNQRPVFVKSSQQLKQ